jgi:hypothetical protein
MFEYRHEMTRRIVESGDFPTPDPGPPRAETRPVSPAGGS